MRRLTLTIRLDVDIETTLGMPRARRSPKA